MPIRKLALLVSSVLLVATGAALAQMGTAFPTIPEIAASPIKS